MNVEQLRHRVLANKKIGLLGGSFNPAHAGHLQMSLFALDRLKLDEIWWIVSPQNPLKSKENMGDYETRVREARALVAPHERIVVTTLEADWNVRYTIDTVTRIRAEFRDSSFVLLMGEDNWNTLHRWHRWEEICLQLPIAVFRRSGYLDSRQGSLAAEHFAHAELSLSSVENLAVSPPPVWAVLDNEPNPLSATQIRQTRQPTL